MPSHIYTFPFAPNPKWSKFYSSSEEILQYINDTAAKFELNQYVQLNTKVVETIWSDEHGYWDVKYEKLNPISGEVDVMSTKAELLINATGFLNRKKLPSIPGLDKFQGTLLHSASWDPKLDCTNKRVGIIGNGSSAIQIVPQLQPKVAHLFEYIRTPTYIIPEFLAEFTPNGTNFEYTDEQKAQWLDDPSQLRDLRRKMEHAFNAYFGIFKQNAPQQAYVREVFTQMMKGRLNGNEELIEKLVPQWPVGCRRITPGHGYLEALQQDNMTARFDTISHVSEKGVVMLRGESEYEDELDILICATGFDVSFSPAWKITGRNGVRLADLWTQNPEAYLGIFAPSMPNYFIYSGPNSPLGHGSLMGALEATTDLIMSMTTKIASQGYKSFCVADDVVREYNDYAQEWLKDTVWASGCSSWYKRASDGRVTAMYPGSVLHYRQMLANIRLEDFTYEMPDNADGTRPNRFRFMGNGTTQLEADQGMLGDYLQM